LDTLCALLKLAVLFGGDKRVNSENKDESFEIMRPAELIIQKKVVCSEVF
jgi:hypothetical protein